ncbi:MAG: hypothetical protein A2487_06555 [Candidatus Raymondbacteria bacterium RifOxyC12_full_50_8]|uniref:PD-(D/E)XK endonuclease-like domain-containing protein n=1 Tax=Candidatus Raymondbacteria bacterium RIFOXYD12_FULL_49_13 TaxID=1817890 RepID=A0A1F7FHZ0_UNCRA|nr:MAG: hypothetical protein A2248_21270 [Candidatus Raymondbacteria bacterium RIFOXYA2_FULL_49_16]OGK02150.1 MAG: hypothetical protein A2350_20135 [Candidatus Raymondbacteria bacterium RifOxyB12_full_50_8]OGK05961.1 MAG: hypothetical protein A2487_06555 [Candidatus Raymondbacteria bacterium RifOxyC12_full_50_8]OGK06319.1 MAG: hypothetical protein A2519_08585 [Candidatus Raymondbacteria bacterium RIFOXYD12_FULL_49_13]OGP40652.1 MAG: hypothetical protein A2324_03340 [Candidatus Raymondbacteria b
MTAPRIQNELSWSASRADIFNRCKREYYYSYYGSFGGWDRNALPEKRELYILKNTRNRYAWMGDVVHQTLERFLTDFQNNKKLSREELTALADARMRSEYRDSLEQRYRERPGSIKGLVEHENTMTIDKGQWRAIHENVVTCTGNFFFTDFYRDIIENKIGTIKRMEKLDHFMFRDVKVYAKPDVAYVQDDRLTILDWKTGKQADEHEFQLYYYVLYGVHKLGVALDCIDASIVYLKDNKVSKVIIEPDNAQRALAYIDRTHAAMEELIDPDHPDLMDIERCPPCLAAATCRLCRFWKKCHSGPADQSHLSGGSEAAG